MTISNYKLLKKGKKYIFEYEGLKIKARFIKPKRFILIFSGLYEYQIPKNKPLVFSEID